MTNLFATAARWVSNSGMIRIIVSLLVTVIAAISAHAAETNAPAPIRISTAEADKHMDESAIVTGKVAQVTIRPNIVFLNMDQAFPDSPFTAVIMAKNTNDFGDLKALEGKSVEVSGKIKAFKDKPEIVLESTNQLTVVGAKADEPKK
jgi:DNA/RNA endonuclease YhcR with UshA esterase domain